MKATYKGNFFKFYVPLGIGDMLEQAEEIRHNLDNLLFNITFNKFRNIYLNIDSSENIHRTDLLMFILIID